MAESRTAGAYPEDLCFAAQQAAEKAIKAVMLKRNIEYPYVHDLAHLLSLLEDAGEVVPDAVRKAEELTPYAVSTRYPGTTRPVTVREYVTAVEIAGAVVRWAEEKL